MRRFFRSKKFIITSALAVTLIVMTVIFTAVGGWATPPSAFFGSVVAPVQELFGNISDGVGGFFATFSNYDKLERENAELREQINSLTKEKLEWQEAFNQNEFYKEFLGIKEEHEDFEMTAASVISRDPADPFGTLTINVGSLDGVSPHDPVITADGVIGYVHTTGPSYSSVVTLLDPSLKISATDRRTDDSGIVSGNVLSVAKGVCRMQGLGRHSTVAKGDYIVTTGGGVFPAGLIIGNVDKVTQTDGEMSVYADIIPSADIKGASSVMVITSFSGQSGFDDLVE